MSHKQPLGIVFFDVETWSQLNLKAVGPVAYAAHPSTELLLFTAVLPSGEELVWAPSKVCGPTRQPTPHAILRWNEHVDRGGVVCAHNAIFDTEILIRLGSRYGFRDPPIAQTICTQALAQMNQLPGKLGACAEYLGLGSKDDPGAAVIRRLADGAKPSDLTGEELDDLWRYGVQDTRLCRDLYYALHTCGTRGWRTYQVVLAENVLGVPVDLELARKCAELYAELGARAKADIADLTGLAKATDPALRNWILAHVVGDNVELQRLMRKPDGGWTIDQHARARLLASTELPELGRKVLEARNLEGTSPLKKYDRIVERAYEGRIHGVFAASPTVTGRHASYDIQLDNLPRVAGFHPDPEADARDILAGQHEKVAARSKVTVPQLLLDMLRFTICAPEGQVLTWGDWSAIEPRVLAWLCNTDESQKVLNVFRAGGDLYAVTAGKMYGVDPDDLLARRSEGDAEAESLRQRGKVAVLALGFGGGPRALLSMAAGYGMEMSWDDAEETVRRYRSANPWLEPFWRQLEKAVNFAIRNPDEEWPVGRVSYRYNRGRLYCRLPCGREIAHHDVRWGRGDRHQRACWAYRVRDGQKATPTRRTLRRTNIVENITQAVAASLLHDLMDRLDAADYEVVASRHDEVLLEGPRSFETELKETMEHVPDWAEGLPLSAEVASGRRYGK